MSYRVVQWTTGNVGKRSVRAVASNPTLQLVGCYAWSDEKVGRDVGDLCGIEPPNPHRVGSAPWKPLLGMSGPTKLLIEFDAGHQLVEVG